MPLAHFKMDAKTHKLHMKRNKILNDCGPEIYAVGEAQNTEDAGAHWNFLCFSRKTANLLWEKACATTIQVGAFAPCYISPSGLNVCNNQIVFPCHEPVDAFATPPAVTYATVLKTDLGLNRSTKFANIEGLMAVDSFTTLDDYTFILYEEGGGNSNSLAIVNPSGSVIDTWVFSPEEEGQVLFGCCIKGQVEEDGVFRIYLVGTITSPYGFGEWLSCRAVYCFSVDTNTREFIDGTFDWVWKSDEVAWALGGSQIYLPRPSIATLKTCYIVSSQWHGDAPGAGVNNGRQCHASVSIITNGSEIHNWTAQLSSQVYPDIWSGNPYAMGAILTNGDPVKFWVANSDTISPANETNDWIEIEDWSSGSYSKGDMVVLREDARNDPFVCIADTSEEPGTGTDESRKAWGQLSCTRGYSVYNWYKVVGGVYSSVSSDRPTCALQYKDGSHYLYFRATSEYLPAWMYKINLTAMTDVEEIPSVLLAAGLNPHIVGLSYSKSDERDFSKVAVVGSGCIYGTGYPDSGSYSSSLDIVDIEPDPAIPAWNPVTEYKIGDLCFDTDTLVYIALTDNDNKQPSAEPTEWMHRAHYIHPTTALIAPVINKEIPLLLYPLYLATSSYAKNDRVMDDNKMWKSLIDGNINHTPAENSYWTQVQYITDTF
jgi:hypothetical protein